MAKRRRYSDRFKQALTEFVMGRGARPGRFYDFELYTPAGVLHVSVNDDWLATRFDDVAMGRRFTEVCGRRCNPYSGKWNFHFSPDTAPSAAIAQVGFYLDRLLEWRPDSVPTAVGQA